MTRKSAARKDLGELGAPLGLFLPAESGLKLSCLLQNESKNLHWQFLKPLVVSRLINPGCRQGGKPRSRAPGCAQRQQMELRDRRWEPALLGDLRAVRRAGELLLNPAF